MIELLRLTVFKEFSPLSRMAGNSLLLVAYYSGMLLVMALERLSLPSIKVFF